MKHVLALSTLYPNAVHPRFGTFVARSLEALAKRGDWQVTVVNPIGLPPLAQVMQHILIGLIFLVIPHLLKDGLAECFLIFHRDTGQRVLSRCRCGW